MIADLKPYPEYKESGLPWLGPVPRHWGLITNRGLIRRRKILVGKRHDSYQLLSLTKQGVIVRDVSSGKGKFSADMGTSQEVRNGDLVFCLFDVPETPRTVGLSRHDGMITGAYTVFECSTRGIAEYFELFYRAMDDHKLLSPLYSGLRNTIPSRTILGNEVATASALRTGGDRAVSGLGERAAGAGDPGETEGDRAAQRAEAGYHPPRRHPRPRPLRSPQTLRHPVARRHSAALGGAEVETSDQRATDLWRKRCR